MSEIDYAAVAVGMKQMIPFTQTLDLDFGEFRDGYAEVSIDDRASIHNHIETPHAGALFTVGETASGGAFIAAFAEIMGTITPLAEKAEIQYKKIARGRITAIGTLGRPKPEILEDLERDSKARFPVNVDLKNRDGETVAQMIVNWYIRKNA